MTKRNPTREAELKAIKRIVLKRRAEGMTWADIAKILGCSPKALNSKAKMWGLVDSEQGDRIRQGVLKAMQKRGRKQ